MPPEKIGYACASAGGPTNEVGKMEIGRLGVWASLDGRIDDFGVDAEQLSSRDTARFAARVEALGYGGLWLPEAAGRNSLVQSAWLLANTSTLIVATGIA